MRVASMILVMAALVVAVAIAHPGGGIQAEEQFRDLLEANDAVIYDRNDPEGFAPRHTRQNIRWVGTTRAATVLIGTNFRDEATCLARCRAMHYPDIIFRNGRCRCQPEIMRIGVVERG